MKIFIIRGAFGEVYEPSWCRALKELGHTVYLFDSHKYLLPGLIGKFERRYLFGLGVFLVRIFSIKLAKKINPDLILLYQGHYHNKTSILKLKKIAWVTGYHNDNIFSAIHDGRHKVRYKHLLGALPFYSSFHVYRNSNVKPLNNIGLKHVSVLKSYYVPWLDLCQHSKSEIYTCDIIFAGHPEPDGREVYLTKLLELGYDLKIFGDPKGWYKLIPKKYHLRLNDIGVLNANDYRIALSSSKICLAFFSKWNRDDYTRRVFEIPAMGKFLFSEKTEMMCSLYKEDEEAVFFSNLEDFIYKIDYYLNNPIERKRVEENGTKRCLNSGYDILSIMNQFINDIELWKKSK